MRAILLLAALTVITPGVALAQNAPAKSTNAVPAAPAEPSDATLHNQLPPTALPPITVVSDSDHVLSSPPPKVGGALARAARARQPWQAINPFAPAEFGQGYENVTEDPHTRQPTGIILVSFGSGRRHW